MNPLSSPARPLPPLNKTPPPPPPIRKSTWADAQRAAATTAPAGFKPKPPPPPPKRPELPEVRPLNTFAEGSTVSIQGLPDMQRLTIERISDGGVTVSGGKLAPHTVLSGASPALLYYERPADAKGPGLTVVVPPGNGDFSSMASGGKVRRTDGFTDPVPAADRIKPRPPGATEADLPARVTRPAAKREGVCAFIDERIMEGGRTAEEVLALVMAKFPGRDPKSTLATVKTRPSHIKAKGTTPPAFKAAK